MGTLPSNVSTFFWTIFTVSFVICVLVPLAIGYWRLARAHATEVASVQPGTIGGMLAGLVASTIVLVVLGNSVLRAPASFLYPAIGLIDLLFLFFLCEKCITAWIITLTRSDKGR